MQLRPYRSSDLSTLHEIDRACFPPGIAYSRNELAGFITHRNSRTWVAEEDGTAIGFVVANRQTALVGHIVTLDVLESWRRHGVGTRLMDAAEAWARAQGLEMIYLETAEDNVPAQQFYAGRGYSKSEKVENYYASGIAAWVMVKGLR